MVSSIPPPTQKAVDQTGFFVEPWYRALNTLGTSINDSVSGSRRVLTEGTTFYVDGASGSSSGDGLSGSPFDHPQTAYDYIAENVDGGGNWVKIHLADGTYEMRTTERTNTFSGSETAVLVMDRNLAGVSAVLIEGQSAAGAIFNGFGVLHNTSGIVRFKNIKFHSPALDGNQGIFARAPGAVIGIEDGCEFGEFFDTGASTAAIHLFSQSICKVFSPITISGGAHRFFYMEGGCMLDWENLAFAVTPKWVTFVGTPTFGYFITLGQNSDATMIGLTFDGSFVGYKFSRDGGTIGVFPYQHPNALLPGTIDGRELGLGNYIVDNATLLPTEWVPTLRFGGSSTGITYNGVVRTGIVPEAGSMTWAFCTFNLSNKGAQTGAATISGLPYAAINLDGVQEFVGKVTFSGVTAPAGGWGDVAAVIAPGAQVIQLMNLPTVGTGHTAITDMEFNNNSSVSVSILYLR